MAQPARLPSLAPFAAPLVRRHASPLRPVLPMPPKPTPITPVAWTVPETAPRAESFLYACRRCRDTNHWTKDCPHRFDVRYLSDDELRKALNDRRASEGLPPLGPPQPKNDTADHSFEATWTRCDDVSSLSTPSLTFDLATPGSV